MALVEFGDQAYVITPFTTDYENILFSMSLIGDWTEFMAFPDQGTVIANAIDQSVGLFRAFDVLDAAGNAMVIFTDGIDAEVTEDGRSGVRRAAAKRARPTSRSIFIRTGVPAARRAGDPGRSVGRGGRAHGRQVLQRRRRSRDRPRGQRDRSRGRRPRRDETLQHRAAALCGVRARRRRALVVALAMRLTMPWFQTFP